MRIGNGDLGSAAPHNEREVGSRSADVQAAVSGAKEGRNEPVYDWTPRTGPLKWESTTPDVQRRGSYPAGDSVFDKFWRAVRLSDVCDGFSTSSSNLAPLNALLHVRDPGR